VAWHAENSLTNPLADPQLGQSHARSPLLLQQACGLGQLLLHLCFVICSHALLPASVLQHA
jgi:hypothetical protein